MATPERPPDALTATVERIDQLIALFNRKAMDLPDGLLERTTQFLLNDAPYETLLGQSPTDPLILMLTRGPAGYRFIAKAIHHAVPDAAVERGEVVWVDAPEVCQSELWLSGHLRDTREEIHLVSRILLTLGPGGSIRRAAVSLDAAAVNRLRQARYTP
jgi:hypothetical protein